MTVVEWFAKPGVARIPFPLSRRERENVSQRLLTARALARLVELEAWQNHGDRNRGGSSSVGRRPHGDQPVGFGLVAAAQLSNRIRQCVGSLAG